MLNGYFANCTAELIFKLNTGNIPAPKALIKLMNGQSQLGVAHWKTP